MKNHNYFIDLFHPYALIIIHSVAMNCIITLRIVDFNLHSIGFDTRTLCMYGKLFFAFRHRVY
jgi:hypothetical protein